MTEIMLKVSGLKVAYGGIQAVKGVTSRSAQGELVSLIGANGAGKTTTLKAITGMPCRTPTATIEFLGEPIKGQGAWDLVKQGLVMVPEGRGVFARMTITENLQMGAFMRNDKRDRGRHRQGVRHLSAPEGAAPPARRHDVRRRAADAGDGRAPDGRPKVLLLDEPSMGLSPDHGRQDLRGDQRHPQRGTTVLLVEQNASRALQPADRGYVMESGEVTMSRRGEGAARRPEGARGLSRRVASRIPAERKLKPGEPP